MKKLIFLSLVFFSTSSQACLIALSDNDHNDDPVILQTSLIKKVVQGEKSTTWITTSSGEKYHVSEKFNEVNDQIKNCYRR